MLLSQVFLAKQKILLYTSKNKHPYMGTVYDLSANKFYFKTEDEIYSFTFPELLGFTAVEKIEDNDFISESYKAKK